MNNKTFSGGIYMEADPPIRESGHITLRGQNLIFANEGRQVELPVRNLKIRFGGTAKRIAYITDPTQNNITLYTTDFSLLRNKALQKNVSARAVVDQRRKHHFLLLFTCAVLSTMVLIPSYFVFIERSFISGLIADQIPVEAEEKLGDYVFNSNFKNETALIKDQKASKALHRLAAPLLDVARDSGYTFQIHILKDPDANAFALPGGHIILHSGLIELSDQPEELLGVMAHEMAHIVERHTLKQVISELSGDMLLTLLFSGTPEWVYSIGNKARFLISQNYSQRQEKAADELGFQYLVEAGISPKGLIGFFEKIQHPQNAAGSEFLALLSTHPTSTERIKNLNRMLANFKGNPAPIAFNYSRFRKQILELSHPNPVETLNERQN